MDYTLAYLDSDWSLIVPKSPPGERSEAIDVTAFLEIFAPGTWTMIFVSVLVIAILSAVIAYHLAQNQDRSKVGHFGCGVNEAYLALIQKCNYVRRDYPGYSGMILFLVVSIFGFVGYTCYVADLTAMVTVSHEVSRPRSFQDVLDQGYTVTTVKGSALETFFKRPHLDPDSPVRKTYENMKLERGLLEYKLRFVEEANTLPRQAYFGSQATFIGVNSLVVLMDFEEREYHQIAIGLQRDSELLDMFNFHLVRMRETGMLNHILHKWMSNRQPADWSKRIFVDDPLQLGFDNLFGPLTIGLVGIGLGCGLTILEIVIFK